MLSRLRLLPAARLCTPRLLPTSWRAFSAMSKTPEDGAAAVPMPANGADGAAAPAPAAPAPAALGSEPRARCRFHFGQGGCRYTADACKFSHDGEPAEAVLSEIPVPGVVAPGLAPLDDSGVKPGEKTITEGTTTIVYGEKNECFYNKVQVLNRDLSILAVRAFDKYRNKHHTRKEKRAAVARYRARHGISSREPQPPASSPMPPLYVLEALAATGLRSVRYCKEIPNVDKIVCNDLEAAAVESIRRNAALNGITEDRLQANQGDAALFMLMNAGERQQFDVVDVDPYGTASPFVNGALQSVAHGGLMCITCTDLAIMCGTHQQSCFPKYGCMPLKSKFCHEQALRMLLATLETEAVKHRRHIVPLLSVQVDFYIRVFVRVFVSPDDVIKSPTKLGYVYQCTGCHSFHTQRMAQEIKSRKGTTTRPVANYGPSVPERCSECGNRFKMGGPVWLDPIYDPEFLDDLLTEFDTPTTLSQHPDELPPTDAGSNTRATVAHSRQRLKGLLTMYRTELVDVPLYYSLTELCSTLKVKTLSMPKFRSALLNAGYRVSSSHIKPEYYKTDAPPKVVWDILRTHAAAETIAPRHREDPECLLNRILAREVTTEVSFKTHKDAATKRSFLGNPEEFWGPKLRASGKREGEPLAGAGDDGAEASPPPSKRVREE